MFGTYVLACDVPCTEMGYFLLLCEYVHCTDTDRETIKKNRLQNLLHSVHLYPCMLGARMYNTCDIEKEMKLDKERGTIFLQIS